MSESGTHIDASEVADNTESQQQQSPTKSESAQPVEHKSEDKTSVSEPEDAKQSQDTETNGEKEVVKTEDNKETNTDAEPEKEEYLNKVAEEMVNEVFSDVLQTEITEVDEGQDEKRGDSKEMEREVDEEKKEKEVCVITRKPDGPAKHIESSAAAVIDTPEVSSTVNDEVPSSKSVRSSRRGSYASSRSYATGYQNYGLTHLPYKSNFEPSEEARRRADEFFKTFKL